MNKDWPAFVFIGLILGMLLMGLCTLIPGTNVQQYNKAIEDCEKDLPRSQTCIISAKPKPIGKD